MLKRTPKRHSHHQYTVLEERNLLASVGFSGTTVVVTGTSASDNVLISPSAPEPSPIVPTIDVIDQSTGQLLAAFKTFDFNLVVFHGNNGNDTVRNEANIELRAFGGNGHDTIVMTGSQRLVALGGAGNDTITGGSRADRLFGENGDDIIRGGGGNDLLNGQSGRDTLFGGSGNDQLYGGDAFDRLYGESGNDFLSGQGGGNHLFGGDGNDNLLGGPNADGIFGNEGNDLLRGGGGNDLMRGHSGNDRIFGGDGNDRLFGDAGFDRLRGEDGADQLRGGDGDDSLWGGLDGDIDQVSGDDGYDRIYLESNQTQDAFLTDADRIRSLGFGNAVLLVQDGDKSFSAGEIEIFDQALDQLYFRVGSNELATANIAGVVDGQFTSRRVTNLVRESSIQGVAVNLSVGVGNADFPDGLRLLAFSDAVFDGTTPQSAKEIIVHELAHSWQLTSNINADLPPQWAEFLELSGWVPNQSPITGMVSGDGQWLHSADAQFATNRDFDQRGQANPFEDFATMWEEYFFVGRSAAGNLGEKLDFIDDFMSFFKSLA